MCAAMGAFGNWGKRRGRFVTWDGLPRMKKGLAVAAVIVVLGGAVCFRYMQVTVNHMGTGETLPSPNKKYEATAYAWWSESFWGNTRHWFEFSIRDVRFGNTIQTIDTAPINGAILRLEIKPQRRRLERGIGCGDIYISSYRDYDVCAFDYGAMIGRRWHAS
jgi:hypothetical protein